MPVNCTLFNEFFYLSRQRHVCHNFQYFRQCFEILVLHLVEKKIGPHRQALDADPHPAKLCRSARIRIHKTFVCIGTQAFFENLDIRISVKKGSLL